MLFIIVIAAMEEGKLSENKEETKGSIEELLMENEELLCLIVMESKCRRNKNMIHPRLSIMIHKLEKNLIRLAKLSAPQCLADQPHVAEEKQRFIQYLSKKTRK